MAEAAGASLSGPSAAQRLAMASDPVSHQALLLVTGMLGAGKSTAGRALEDVGWEVIDNFPIRLLGAAVADMAEDGPLKLAIGFDAHTRGFDPATIMAEVGALRARTDRRIGTLFLDCGTRELTRRYNETRRPHPWRGEGPLDAGIRADRELLAPLRAWADLVIDTSEYSAADLQHRIREQFGAERPGAPVITVTSFGFSRGTPPLADYVFDMRFLDNPYWDTALRAQTGRDGPVQARIAADPLWAETSDAIHALMLRLIERFTDRGKSYVTIAFGCTGGRHRSVFAAEHLSARLREAGFSPNVLHRDLGARPAGMMEGSATAETHGSGDTPAS